MYDQRGPGMIKLTVFKYSFSNICNSQRFQFFHSPRTVTILAQSTHISANGLDYGEVVPLQIRTNVLTSKEDDTNNREVKI